MAVPYGFDYPVTPELQEKVASVLARRIHHSGPYTEEAQERIAQRFGCSNGIAVNSGTSACLTILQALGLGEGDEVIVPGTAYITSAETVMQCGARPVFVECEPDTLNIDPDAVRAAINSRTAGIIVVHQYGHPVDLDPICDLAKRNNLWLVENCCHALGASYKGNPVGSYGDAGFVALSRKHLSVCGTGGVAFTNDEELAKKVAMISIHGRKGYFEQESHLLGHNFRFNEIQACIACHQLDQVDNWIEARRSNAALYDSILSCSDIPVSVPPERDYAYHSYLHYVIQTESRDVLREFLNSNGVGSNIHYRVACHLHPVFRELLETKPGQLPISEKACDRILTLPATPNISSEQVKEVASRIKEFFAE